jgi:hypothetical protein
VRANAAVAGAAAIFSNLVMLLSLVCWLLTASPRTWDGLAQRATRAWLVRSQFCYW